MGDRDAQAGIKMFDSASYLIGKSPHESKDIKIIAVSIAKTNIVMIFYL